MAEERRRKNKKTDERQEEIIDAAEKLFREKGFLETSIADIIKAVGLSHGAIYHHFPNKKSILIGLGKARFKKVRANMRRWIEDPSLTPRQKIELVLKQFNSDRNLRLTVDHFGLGFIREDPELHDTVLQLFLEPMSRDLAELIAQGVDSGEFDVADPLSVAVTINLLFAQLIHRAGSTERIVSWPALFESLQLSVMRMLGVRNSAAPARTRPSRAK